MIYLDQFIFPFCFSIFCIKLDGAIEFIQGRKGEVSKNEMKNEKNVTKIGD